MHASTAGPPILRLRCTSELSFTRTVPLLARDEVTFSRFLPFQADATAQRDQKNSRGGNHHNSHPGLGSMIARTLAAAEPHAGSATLGDLIHAASDARRILPCKAVQRSHARSHRSLMSSTEANSRKPRSAARDSSIGICVAPFSKAGPHDEIHPSKD